MFIRKDAYVFAFRVGGPDKEPPWLKKLNETTPIHVRRYPGEGMSFHMPGQGTGTFVNDGEWIVRDVSGMLHYYSDEKFKQSFASISMTTNLVNEAYDSQFVDYVDDGVDRGAAYMQRLLNSQGDAL